MLKSQVILSNLHKKRNVLTLVLDFASRGPRQKKFDVLFLLTRNFGVVLLQDILNKHQIPEKKKLSDFVYFLLRGSNKSTKPS